MRNAVGIDHGTTYSSVSAVRTDRTQPNMVKLDGSALQTPTVLAIDDSKTPHEVQTGKVAENQDRLYPERVLKWYKPLMEDDPDFTFKGFSLVDLTAMTLKSLKEQVEKQINEKLDSVVVTVPAWFHDRARKMTVEGAKQAGINDVYLENEPTAAAWYCHSQIPMNVDDVMMVFDLGGGTFDVSIVQYRVDGFLKVLASHGDMKLGGHLWTLKLQEKIAARYFNDHGIDLTMDAEGQYDLYHACEDTKRQLTSLGQAEVRLRPADKPPQDYDITRTEFEECTRALLDKSGEVMSAALGQAKLMWSDVTEIMLVGGTTRMPMVESYIDSESGKRPLRRVGDRDHVVAQGAAMLQKKRLETMQAKGIDPAQPPNPSNPNADPAKLVFGKITRTNAHNLSTWIINETTNKLSYAVVLPAGEELPAKGKRTFERQREKVSEIQVPVFEGGTEGEEIDLRKDIAGYKTLWKFHGIPDASVEKNEIEISYHYNSQQMIEVKAIYKPGTADEKDLQGVEEAWEEMKDIDNANFSDIPLVVAIDCSGSMNGQPIRDAKQQLCEIADEYLANNFNLSVISFPHRIFGNAGEVVRCSTDPQQVRDQINQLISGGGTPMTEGLELAREVMNEVSDSSMARYIFLITDGAPANPNTTREAARAIRADGTKLFAIPISPSHSGVEFLADICDQTEPIDNAGRIGDAFRNLLKG